MRKPVGNVISIDSARAGNDNPDPSPVSARMRRKSNTKQALRLFFLMGAGIWKVQRQTGTPTVEVEQELRELAWQEWERREGRRAA